MKPGGSGLNPDAAAYVPLSKRDGESAKPAAAAAPATHPYVAHGYGGVKGEGSYPGSQMYMPKTAASSEKQMSDEDLEMDTEIEFLLSPFSDFSYESIRDVYLANNRDLDATIEMLNQLEIFSNEAEKYLPDTLDIGDVPETIEPSTSSAPKQNNASTSTSSRTTNAPSS